MAEFDVVVRVAATSSEDALSRVGHALLNADDVPEWTTLRAVAVEPRAPGTILRSLIGGMRDAGACPGCGAVGGGHAWRCALRQ